MEKILKKILYFIILFVPFLFLNNVYADEVNVYFEVPMAGFDLKNNPDISNTKLYTFNFKDNVYNFYSSNLSYNSSVLYDKVNDLLLFVSFGECPNSSSVNILGGYNFQCGLPDNWNNSSVSEYMASVSNDEQIDYFKNIYGSSSRVYSGFLNNFYINEVYNYRSWDYIRSFLFNNSSNFELVKNSTNEFYINNNKIPNYVESVEPEEPEDPDIPIFNNNLNKFYVPNYKKGQCIEILDKDTIRVFENENTDFYIDYYINSNYISRQGQVDLNYEKHCSTLEFTDIRYYGNDFPQILFITIIICGFTIVFPYILYKRFRKR